jgi:hypothetical protein
LTQQHIGQLQRQKGYKQLASTKQDKRKIMTKEKNKPNGDINLIKNEN